MPTKICGLGFDCASMMLQPGLLDSGECLNYKTCGSAMKLSPDEEIELIRVRLLEQERFRETFRITRRQAAIMMLMARGCPQTAHSLGVTERIDAIASLVEQLHSQLNNKEGQYIAPTGCEVHHYSVKRPSGVYGYKKLTAREPIFEPSIEKQLVKVIHLSHDNDPRFLEAQLGIERRNRLMRVRTLLTTAESLLRSCVNTLTEESPEDNSLLIRAPEVESVLQERLASE